MKSTNARRVASSRYPARTTEVRSQPVTFHQLATPLQTAILCARQSLLSEQRADGSWQFSRPGDTRATAQMALLWLFLERDDDPLVEQLAATLVETQRSDGGWSRDGDDRFDLDSSVLAYFVLKLSGHPPQGTNLRRARRAILAGGGADQTDSQTRWWLALFGQVDYDICSPLAPELLCLPPGWWPEGIDTAGLAARSLVWAHRPVRAIDAKRGVLELFVTPPKDWPRPQQPLWRFSLEMLIRFAERRGITPLRRHSLELAEKSASDLATSAEVKQSSLTDLAWLAIALHATDHQHSNPTMVRCIEAIQDRIGISDGETTAWGRAADTQLEDTSTAIVALIESGLTDDDPTLCRAIDWLLERTADMPISDLTTRDNSMTTPELVQLLGSLQLVADGRPTSGALPPGLHVCEGSHGADRPDPVAVAARRRRAEIAATRLQKQLLARQNADGGWSKPTPAGKRRSQSASSALLTSRVLEIIPDDPAATQRGTAYLRRTQRANGCWADESLTASTTSTASAICGLLRAGVPTGDQAIAAAVNWLLVHQHSDGGWAETPADVASHEAQCASATSATCHALRALVAAGEAAHDVVAQSVAMLLEAQHDTGDWSTTLARHEFSRPGNLDGQVITGPLVALSQCAREITELDLLNEPPLLRLVGAAE